MAVEISRRDIVSDYIFDYTSEDKFLKLPVEPYMELLGITPLASQMGIINAVNNPKDINHKAVEFFIIKKCQCCKNSNTR